MTAKEVSRYVADYAYRMNHAVSNLQLQKIMYFLWIEYYKVYREALFSDQSFEAWRLGPVLRNVYYDFCSFGSMTIYPILAGFSDIKLNCLDGTKNKTINRILDNYISLPARELVDLSHKENHAWDVIFRKGEGASCRIPFEKIIELECN